MGKTIIWTCKKHGWSMTDLAYQAAKFYPTCPKCPEGQGALEKVVITTKK